MHLPPRADLKINSFAEFGKQLYSCTDTVQAVLWWVISTCELGFVSLLVVYPKGCGLKVWAFKEMVGTK